MKDKVEVTGEVIFRGTLVLVLRNFDKFRKECSEFGFSNLDNIELTIKSKKVSKQDE